MRLRQNEMCPIHKSVSCFGGEVIAKPKLIRMRVQRIEDPHHFRRYRELRSPAEMRKLLKRKILEQSGSVRSGLKNLLITTMWCRITGSRKGWAAHSETTTQTTSKRYSGAIRKKDQPETESTDGRSAIKQETLAQILIVSDWLRVSCGAHFRFMHSQGGTQLWIVNDHYPAILLAAASSELQRPPDGPALTPPKNLESRADCN